ncbi:hypothetical protein A2U01_0081777, partial [Trifolium medium]|nr:hypothetical protein [Trifolium medium]
QEGVVTQLQHDILQLHDEHAAAQLQHQAQVIQELEAQLANIGGRGGIA